MVSKIRGEKSEKTKNLKETKFREKIRKERGITLIALAVSVIILLILAGITIQMLIGDEGLLKKAGEAAVKSEIADYEEQLELLGVDQEMDDTVTGEGHDGFLDRYKDKITNEETFKDSDVRKRGDDSLIVETEEGYIFEVTEEGTDYLGKRGDKGLEELPEDITEEDIEITWEPEEWAQEVNVTIDITEGRDELEKFTIEYSEDKGTTWHEYTESFTVSKNNTEISARLTNKIGETPECITTEKITNIDTVLPGEITLETTKTTNSITVIAKVTDGDETDVSGKSGIKQIDFYCAKDDENLEESKTTITIPDDESLSSVTKEVKFDELIQTTPYHIKVVATDKAGNEKIKEDTVTTETMPEGGNGEDGNIKISVNPDTWTNKQVTVTIEKDIEGYLFQYSTNGSDWSTVSEREGNSIDLLVKDNCTIYARLYDGTNVGTSATCKITIIDKLAPEVRINDVTKNTRSITVKATGTDKGETEQDGSSKVNKLQFYYSKDDGVSWEDPVEKDASDGEEVEYTFDELVQGTPYKVKVVALDTAGNDSENGNADGLGGYTNEGKTEETESTKEQTTETIPDKTNITITYTPEDTWTKQVSVTVSTTVSGYTIQYKTNDSSWVNVSEALTTTWDQTTNCTVTARLWDGVNGGSEQSKEITNIDAQKPNTIEFEEVSSTTNSIKIKASVSDQEKTEESGKSGIKEISFYYSENNAAPWVEGKPETVIDEESAQNTVETEITFDGLKQNTPYYIKAVAKDNAENEIETNYETPMSTKTVPAGGNGETGPIRINYSPEEWTKTSVNVTITSDLTDQYEIQYAVGTKPENDNGWLPYENEIPVAKNGTTIYARLWDGNNGGECATGTVANIDTVAPKEISITRGEEKSKSISVSVNAADGDKTDDSGISGIKELKYYYRKKAEGEFILATQKPVEPSATVSDTYEYTELIVSQVYELKVEAVDQAGNSKESEIITGETKGTPPTVSISSSKDYSGGTHSITLNVTGQDSEGGQLSYKLDYGLTSSYGSTDSKTGTAGNAVTFTLSGLSEDTTYYYRVIATDDSNLTGEKTGSERTYCVGTYCSGSTTTSKDCSYCDGGWITTTSDCSNCADGYVTETTKCSTCRR